MSKAYNTLLQTDKAVVSITIPKDLWGNIRPQNGAAYSLGSGMMARVVTTGYCEDIGYIALERMN